VEKRTLGLNELLGSKLEKPHDLRLLKFVCVFNKFFVVGRLMIVELARFASQERIKPAIIFVSRFIQGFQLGKVPIEIKDGPA